MTIKEINAVVLNGELFPTQFISQRDDLIMTEEMAYRMKNYVYCTREDWLKEMLLEQ